MSGPDDIEAFLEDLRRAMDDARRDEMDARIAGDDTEMLRARMRYHNLRETYQNEVQASTNRMMRDYIESELLKRWKREQRKLRKAAKRAKQEVENESDG